MRAVLTVIGVLALLMGLLWIGQGLGYIHWPPQSFMISHRRWALYGAILAVIGVALIGYGRRR
jgi:hypothetical protein